MEVEVPDAVRRDHEISEEPVRQQHLHLLVVGRHVALKVLKLAFIVKKIQNISENENISQVFTKAQIPNLRIIAFVRIGLSPLVSGRSQLVCSQRNRA